MIYLLFNFIFHNLKYFFLYIVVKKAICMYIYKENQNVNKRDIFIDKFGSWDIPIKYQIDPPLEDNIIKEAMKEIEKNTCITFTKADLSKNDTQGIVFQQSKICASGIGLVNYEHTQIIQLTDGCSKNKGVILHELGHALGLVHEQSRKDRNKYVSVDTSNIEETEKVNFQIQPHPSYRNFSIYYNYNSIMHYGQRDFEIRSHTPVLKSILHSEYDRMMGQRFYMTFTDFKQLNLAHCDKCNITGIEKKERTKPKEKNEKTKKDKRRKKGEKRKKDEKTKKDNPCLNGGYPNFTVCDKCICPLGYTGSVCKDLEKSEESCGNTTFKVTKDLYKYGLLGKKKCFIFLLAEKEKKIEIVVYYANARSKEICTEDVSHQIKHLADKGTTGLLLCSFRRDPIKLTSDLNSILIYYNGQDTNHFLQIGFKEAE
uniref:Metalloendopeptidase n=1 Tax=Strongyloides papillosus TaxID=174720 RepID=A0A0N5BTW7_STREA